MATKFSPCKGSYVLNQFPSNVMFGMNGFHVSASGAIQGHHGPLVLVYMTSLLKTLSSKAFFLIVNLITFIHVLYIISSGHHCKWFTLPGKNLTSVVYLVFILMVHLLYKCIYLKAPHV